MQRRVGWRKIKTAMWHFQIVPFEEESARLFPSAGVEFSFQSSTAIKKKVNGFKMGKLSLFFLEGVGNPF